MGYVIMAGIIPPLSMPASAPAPATNLTVAGSQFTATITWVNPTDDNFYQVIVTQKAGSAPTGPTDGEQIYVGTGNSTTAYDLSVGTTYYWAVFVMNDEADYDKSFPTARYATPSSYDKVLFYNGTGDLGTATVGSAYYTIRTDGCQRGYYDGCHSGVSGGVMSYDGSQVFYCIATCGECGCDVYGASYSFVTGIDLTNISKISITASANINGGYTNYEPCIAISSEQGRSGSYGFRDMIVKSKTFSNSVSAAEYTFEVSTFKGLHYFGAVIGCSDCETSNAIYISKIVATYNG